MLDKFLFIHNLSVGFLVQKRFQYILEKVDLEVKRKSIMALVGGSGSGKTTLGLSILRLLSYPLTIESGSIYFEGNDLFSCSLRKTQQVRGKEIAMVFQEPLYSLNPVFRIGYQIEEVIRYHTKTAWNKRKKRVQELLDIVGIKEPARVARSYPHQLSGGMRQRAMIAQAIAAQPKLVIADEPTSNLDVTLQAKILELFGQLKEQMNLSILLITHDLGLVKHFSDEISVISQGKIVEAGRTEDVLAAPMHAYTGQLMKAMDFS